MRRLKDVTGDGYGTLTLTVTVAVTVAVTGDGCRRRFWATVAGDGYGSAMLTGRRLQRLTLVTARQRSSDGTPRFTTF